MTASAASTTLHVLTRFDSRGRGGEFFAETHISTESAPPSQDARVSHAHEDGRRPQSACGAPQEGTPSPYAHLELRMARGRIFQGSRACCEAPNTKPCMAPVSADRALSLLFSSARGERSRRAAPTPEPPGTTLPGRVRSAASASASRRPWVAQCCAIAFAAASAKSCGAIGRRFLRDGTS